MAHKLQIPVVRVNDDVAVDLLAAVCTDAGLGHSQITCNAISGDSFSVSKPSEPSLLNYRNAKQYILYSIAFVGNDKQVALNRPTEATNGFSGLRGVTDNIQITGTATDVLNISMHVRRHFSVLDDKTYLDFLPKEMQDLFKGEAHGIDQLKDMQADFIRRGTEMVQQIADQTLKVKQQLEKAYSDKEGELETGVKARHSALDAKEADLNARKKELDDSEHKVARRKRFEAIIQKFSERNAKTSLSPYTRSLRLPVHILCLALMAVFFTSAAVLFRDSLIKKPDEITVSRIVSQSSLSFLFVAVAWFYISWNNRWFQRHADEELRITKLDLDMERANYLAELAMEWKDYTKADMPDGLIETLSANLFADGRQIDHDLTPAQLLANALFGTAAQVKVTTANSEVLLDKKSISQLSKKGAAERDQ